MWKEHSDFLSQFFAQYVTEENVSMFAVKVLTIKSQFQFLHSGGGDPKQTSIHIADTLSLTN